MKKGYKVIPAVIAGSQAELNQMIFRVDSYVALIQIDVMDGKFVKNKSNFFDFELPTRGIEYEAHLMVEDPGSWIDQYGSRVNTIIVHFEATGDLEKIIKKIKRKRKRVGVALNPKTSIDEIKPYLNRIDQVLIMTVHPGRYGAKYLPAMEEKIKALREVYQGDIEVDGGITDKTIGRVKEAGANMFCSGSYIMKNAKVNKAIGNLKRVLK